MGSSNLWHKFLCACVIDCSSKFWLLQQDLDYKYLHVFLNIKLHKALLRTRDIQLELYSLCNHMFVLQSHSKFVLFIFFFSIPVNWLLKLDNLDYSLRNLCFSNIKYLCIFFNSFSFLAPMALVSCNVSDTDVRTAALTSPYHAEDRKGAHHYSYSCENKTFCL